MNEDLRNRMQAIFDRIEGGSTTDMYGLIDEAIEAEEITQEEYQDNEFAICAFFDSHWFTCVVCGWTLPMDMLTVNDTVELTCIECSPEDAE